jgi:hypothetical protein
MEEIRDIVNSVVRGCKLGGLEVQEVLAAFVARTVVEGSTSTFALDKTVTPERREQIVIQSIEKLLERDNPSLETLKMQVEYDSSFLKEDLEAQRVLRLRSKMIASHKLGITDVEMEDANDFESLTILYRKIFKFLIDYPPNAKPNDRLVEREVAAALESVFPRIGLKAFLGLTKEERSAQLMELARITLGIRLFNREQGRGGAGIPSMDKDAAMLSAALVRDIDREVEFFADACSKYQVAILRARLDKRRGVIAEHKAQSLAASAEAKFKDIGAKAGGGAAAVVDEDPPVREQRELLPDYVIERWQQELANRRQYLNFLRTLQDEVRTLKQKISALGESVQLELLNVQTLVTNKSAVPKEQVYPRFDTLGSHWVRLYEEVTVLMARSNTFSALCNYRLSFNPTLLEQYYDQDGPRDAALAEADEKMWSGAGRVGAGEGDGAEHKGSSSSQAKGRFDAASSSDAVASADAAVSSNGATLLTVHNTPDFMLLPLELQGYCPWTLCHAKGFLVPGKPGLGVIRYDNMYFVCDHAVAIEEFIRNPEFYLDEIRSRGLHHPEFIYLLRLEKWFPQASIARLLEQDDFDPRAVGGKPSTRDAATGTPTHFQESYFDMNYHWNEWELRRRALRVVALKGCATSTTQTDTSHFRRDNETQVFEERERGSQTRRDAGVNPPVVVQYVAGLRGKAEGAAVSKFVRPDADEAKAEAKAEAKPSVRVISLTLDL